MIHSRMTITVPTRPAPRSTLWVEAAARGDDQVVQVAKNRDEIGDQVDGTEGMCDYKKIKAFAYHGVRGSLAAR